MLRVEVNHDASLAEALERGVGWRREPGEVARRFEVGPEGNFVALVGDAVAGTASCLVHGALAWIGGMVVLPQAQRHGIGRALLRHCLAHAEARGAVTVGLDATAAGEPLYASEGFVPVGRTARWARPGLAPREVGAEAPPPGYALAPVGPGELMEVLAYDAPRFGARRGPWLAAVLRSFPDRAFVAYDRGAGEVAGFVLAHGSFLGPLVADASEAAAVLLHATEAAGSAPRAHLPDGNQAATQVFRDAGYAPEPGAVCLRMVRGAPLRGNPRAVFALGGWAVG